MLIVLLFMVHVGVHAQPALTKSQYTQTVKNGVNKLNVEFAKILINDLKPEGNFIFSPLNVYSALALVHLGATGTTKNELSGVLGLPAEDNKLAEAHENFGKLLNDIQNPNFDSAKVSIASGLFTQKELKINDSYAKGTKNYYKSESQQVDFAKGGSEATDTINKWVSEKTKNRISKLFVEQIPTDTIILLASSLYFAGKWKDSFSESNTEAKNFNTGVKQIKVQTMSSNKSIPYYNFKDKQFEAISLPYLYGDFSMLIVLPYQNQSVKSLIASLKPEQLPDIVASLKHTYVNYQIPRMKFRWSQDINQHLIKIGIKQMFDKAELDNMVVDLKNVAVSKVTHAAEIEVNEEGTVASAVTALQIVLMSLPHHTNPPVPFHLDRPFIFSIYHQDTRLTLFTGVVQNPIDENA